MDNMGVFGSSKYGEEWRITYVDKAKFAIKNSPFFATDTPQQRL